GMAAGARRLPERRPGASRLGRDVEDAKHRGVRSARRSVPAGTAWLLLPDAGLGRRCGRPGPGDTAAGVARLRRLRGQVVAANLAVPDRYQRVLARTRDPRQAAAAVGSW